MILQAAIEFFGEKGFAAQTRELALQIGVSEPLIYRYFGTKEALVQRVYQEVMVSRWDPTWEPLLRDRSVPLRTRLLTFYVDYLNAIDDRTWIRIVMYSSLAGLNLTRRYIGEHVEAVMATIAEEVADTYGMDEPPDKELMWHPQSMLIYYVIRKHIHQSPINEDKVAEVTMVVNSFLEGVAGAAAHSVTR